VVGVRRWRARCGLPTTQELSVRCPPATVRTAGFSSSCRSRRSMLIAHECIGLTPSVTRAGCCLQDRNTSTAGVAGHSIQSETCCRGCCRKVDFRGINTQVGLLNKYWLHLVIGRRRAGDRKNHWCRVIPELVTSEENSLKPNYFQHTRSLNVLCDRFLNRPHSSALLRLIVSSSSD
jgi:hypothetical protein